jgi:hypothetical protein
MLIQSARIKEEENTRDSGLIQPKEKTYAFSAIHPIIHKFSYMNMEPFSWYSVSCALA